MICYYNANFYSLYNTPSDAIGCITCTMATNHAKAPFFSSYCDIKHPPSFLPPKLCGNAKGHSKDMHTPRILQIMQFAWSQLHIFVCTLHKVSCAPSMQSWFRLCSSVCEVFCASQSLTHSCQSTELCFWSVRQVFENFIMIRIYQWSPDHFEIGSNLG